MWKPTRRYRAQRREELLPADLFNLPANLRRWGLPVPLIMLEGGYYPYPDLLRKVHIRARRTFDSFASQQLGKMIVQPRVFAPVGRERLEQPATDRQRFSGPARGDGRPVGRPKLGEQNRTLADQLDRTRSELTALQNAAPVIRLVPVVDHHLRDAVSAAADDLAKIATGYKMHWPPVPRERDLRRSSRADLI